MIQSILVHLDGHITQYIAHTPEEVEDLGVERWIQRNDVSKDPRLSEDQRRDLVRQCTVVRRVCERDHKPYWIMVRVDNPEAHLPELWQSYCTRCWTQIQFGYNPLA